MKSFDHLLGLSYELGVTDCYSAIRNFYRDVFEIELRDYVRPERFWEKNLDLYSDNYQKEGFGLIHVPAHHIQFGDVFLIALGASFPTHAAIYVGNGEIFHHFTNRLSVKESYKGLWRNHTVATLRHPEAAQKYVDNRPNFDFDIGANLPPFVKAKIDAMQARAEAEAGSIPPG